ncbi:hypothetical protein [Bradyrhizobium lupini]
MPQWAVSSHGIVMLPPEKKNAVPSSSMAQNPGLARVIRRI